MGAAQVHGCTKEVPATAPVRTVGVGQIGGAKTPKGQGAACEQESRVFEDQ